MRLPTLLLRAADLGKAALSMASGAATASIKRLGDAFKAMGNMLAS